MLIRRLLLIVCMSAGAILLSQFPEFFQQYLQRLGGRLDEINLQVAQLDERAAAAGLDRYDYIRKFIGNGDPVIRREGRHLVDLVGRQVVLSQAYDALENAPPPMWAVRFAQHYDQNTAAAAMRIYRPAVSLSVEGAVYAAVGLLLGALVFVVLSTLVPRRRARSEPAGPYGGDRRNF